MLYSNQFININPNPINIPVMIQDLIVTGATLGPGSTGEFAFNLADENTQQTRLLALINDLMDRASYEHKRTNCYNGNFIRQDSENNITRLVTNEFSFYTKKPLTLQEFNALFQQITNLAKQQPENLHLVLSSFAVKTPDNKVMNVVAHIECGLKPILNFTVKNNASNLDPLYTETLHGQKIPLLNVDIKKGDRVDMHGVWIDGKMHPFTFNNVFECKTVGGAKFNTCVEICLDHGFSTAKKYLNQKLQQVTNHGKELFPSQCSHIYTSNSNYIIFENAMGFITHADPYHSNVTGCKLNTLHQRYPLPASSFGPLLQMTVTSPAVCSILPIAEFGYVTAYNNSLIAKATIPANQDNNPFVMQAPPVLFNIPANRNNNSFVSDVIANIAFKP